MGRLTVVLSADGRLKAIRFPAAHRPPAEARRAAPLVSAQLDEYFAGERTEFELEMELAGTPFQLAVWSRLRRIPYGSTAGYGEIAEDLEDGAFPSGLETHERARAVGVEVGRTPVPIVVPCHRVVGADGSLTGYGGGLERKRALLDLESAQLTLLSAAG